MMMTSAFFSFTRFRKSDTATAPYDIIDNNGGYIIRATHGPSTGVIVMQLLAFLAGVGFLTAGIGIVLLPVMTGAADLGLMRVGAAVLYLAIAGYLLWFATRGSHSELHVDIANREMRETVTNYAGRPTTIARHQFGNIDGVFVERRAKDGQSQLVLRFDNHADRFVIAQGSKSDLAPLYDRLTQHLAPPLVLSTGVTP